MVRSGATVEIVGLADQPRKVVVTQVEALGDMPIGNSRSYNSPVVFRS